MKIIKTLGIAAGALGLALAATSANAVTVGGTEVGSVDNLMCWDNLGNSSDADELAFMETCTGEDLTFDKSEDLSELIQEGDYNAINVSPSTPGYFLLKIGGGQGTTGETHFVFENLDLLTFLVWTDSGLVAVGGATNTNGTILGLSHFAITGNTSTTTSTTTSTSGDVPEPGTLTLMGLGLLGLGFSRRFRKAA